VVFWSPGEGPAAGRAVNQASPYTSVTLSVGRSLAPGSYQWGVFLAQSEPWARIRFLGEGGAITVSGGNAGSDSGGSDSPAEPGGKDGKGS